MLYRLLTLPVIALSVISRADDTPPQPPPPPAKVPAVADGGVYEVPRTLQDCIVEPSPEASTFNRYIYAPVSYSTCTAQVSIPLVQWESGPFDMGLSISYHTAGIKTEDVAGHVGLGWTLEGLGCISRSIHSMPDESATAKFNLRTGNFSLSYMLDLMELRAEANCDRYHYSLPGRSGSFVISGGTVRQFPETDLKIEFISAESAANGIDRFTVTTPQGIIYTFAEKERVEYTYSPNPVPMPYYSHDYTAVSSWLLTRISDTENTESIDIAYCDIPSWTRNHYRQLYTTAYCWNSIAVNSGFVPSGPPNIGAMSQSKYVDRKRPLKISSHTATVDFAVTASQWGFTMKNHSGKVIRKVIFDNSRTFDDGRTRLDGVKIEVDGVTVDCRKFTYYSGKGSKGHSDCFGFANDNTANGDDSVLDRNGEPSSVWTYDFSGVRGLSLHTMEDALGAVTTFDYEPSVRAADATARLQELKIGMRIRKITVNDRTTGRTRIREFTYEDPVPSAELSRITLSSYIALAGVDTYSPGAGLTANRSHTISATMTASSRMPGFPIENTVIYYGKVTESVSGTGIDRPVKTSYEFDVTHCLHQFVRTGRGIGSASLESGLSRYLGGDIVPSNGTADDYLRNQRLFSSKSVTSYFKEYIGEGPVLKRRTDYVWRNGSYEPHETSEYFHSAYNKKDFITGLYCESLVFKTVDISMQTRHNITSLDDLNYFNTSVATSRMLCDTVITTRHFADDNTRTSVTRTIHQNSFKFILKSLVLDPDKIHRFYHPGFICDTIIAPSGSWRPLSVSVSCLGETMALHSCDSEQVTTSTYAEAKKSGLYRLPVADKWINVEGDSIERLYHYRRFTAGVKSFMRPSTVVLRTSPDNIIERRDISAYSTYAHPAACVRPDGSSISYTWGHDGDCLTSKTIMSLKTDYTHIPLVGVSQIKSPSGARRDFTYSAGRLATEKNGSGLLLNSYTYSIYENDGVNRLSVDKGVGNARSLTSCIYDGFGMPVRDISHNTSSTGQHVHSATLYDALDRVRAQYRPVADASAGYMSDSGIASAAAGEYGDARAFTEVIYEAWRDPRPQAVISPGEEFESHPALSDYLCNTLVSPLDCRRYSIDPARTKVTLDGLYPPGALDVVRATDPDGHVTLIFTDWRGNQVLRRTLMPSGNIDTYFINDGWGNQLVVLQPEGSARFSVTGSSRLIDSDPVLRDYAFIYRYNKCLRQVYRRVPGCEPVTCAYDTYGRKAFMQDGNLRSQGRFMFMLYDAASRPVMTGLCSSKPSVVPPMTATFTGSASGIGNLGYTAPGLSLADAEPLLVNYYDSYLHTSLPVFSSLRDVASFSGGKGLLTGVLNRVLSSDIDSSCRVYIAEVYGYDSDDRLKKSVVSGLREGLSSVTNSVYMYDDGPVSRTMSLHMGDSTVTGHHVYTYDKAGRLSTVQFAFNDLPAFNSMAWRYNNAGLIANADYAGYGLDYTYTTGGAIRTIGNSTALQTFRYHDGAAPCYNGNISSVSVTPLSAGVPSSMDYVYDGADRLVSAKGTEGVSLSDIFTKLEVCSYDLNSNITSLTRTGKTSTTGSAPEEFGVIDDLTMAYYGNRLKKVTDRADEVLLEASSDFHDGADNEEEYDYDGNGNRVRDDNRGIDYIEYNVLNLPGRVMFVSGDRIDYIYDASGRKLAAVYTAAPVSRYGVPALPTSSAPDGEPVAAGALSGASATLRREYLSGCEIENGAFTRLNTSFGCHDGTAFYSYVPDYQGNIAAVIKAGTKSAVQFNIYYPYGLPSALSRCPEVNRYKFGAKEFDMWHGLNLYDFEARFYDSSTGTFGSADSHAGSYPWFSPYVYCGGNPIRNIDPTGMDIWSLDEMGRILERIEDHNKDLIRLLTNDGSDRTDSDGNRLEISFDYGTIELQRTISYDADKYYDVYQVRGDENATQMFEFLSDHIAGIVQTEYSLIRTGVEGDRGLNFIATGHKRGSEPGMTHLYNGQLNYGYTIRSMTHSHPVSDYPGKSDKQFYSDINNSQQKIIPQYIYHVPTKRYIPF